MAQPTMTLPEAQDAARGEPESIYTMEGHDTACDDTGSQDEDDAELWTAEDADFVVPLGNDPSIPKHVPPEVRRVLPRVPDGFAHMVIDDPDGGEAQAQALGLARALCRMPGIEAENVHLRVHCEHLSARAEAAEVECKKLRAVAANADVVVTGRLTVKSTQVDVIGNGQLWYDNNGEKLRVITASHTQDFYCPHCNAKITGLVKNKKKTDGAWVHNTSKCGYRAWVQWK